MLGSARIAVLIRFDAQHAFMPRPTTTRDEAIALIAKSISRIISIDEQEMNTLLGFFRIVKVAKKDHWLQPGEVCTEIAFILKGCIRYYYPKNGIERTGQFFFENSWFTDYESWLTKQGANIGIDALEDSELFMIPYRELERLYEANPKFERLGRVMAENTIIGIRNRNISLLNDSPEERYLKLVKERPKVIQRIPQHVIASYLGIEPETLSRIRKKLTSQTD